MSQNIHRVKAYFRLMRFDRPIGIWLLMWPMLWGLWVASNGDPNPKVFIVFVLGVVIMRAAGCVINDFADRCWDGEVERTKDRPLVTGDVSEYEAIALFVVLMALAFFLVLNLNSMTIILSVVAGLLTASYPFLKRFTDLPQLGLGVAFSWSIPMVFAAQTKSVPLVAGGLFFVSVIWTVCYDTIYAMVDRDDDKEVGILSTAIRWENHDRLAILLLQIATLAGLAGMAFWIGWIRWFWIGWWLAAALFVYQQWLIASGKRDQFLKAFLNNHPVGFVIFLGIWMHYQFT
ncbi:MAG: 4-hydroxybenzoate octaprenyltransferase [Gammaproteobacteria bacterium]|nr:4-hydroxybenzoate octaprenyltransferase [Gammaproteobacteria bacterium]